MWNDENPRYETFKRFAKLIAGDKERRESRKSPTAQGTADSAQSFLQSLDDLPQAEKNAQVLNCLYFTFYFLCLL
jgi:hypothetical protein